MKYKVDLRQVKFTSIEVIAESAANAALLAESRCIGFQANIVMDEGGEEWTVDGKCEGCSVHLLDGEYFVDGNGCNFCNKCWAELLAETEFSSGGQ